MKYVLALLVCAGIFFLYIVLGMVLFGWEHGGGLIPNLILFAALGATWRAITKKQNFPKGGNE